MKSKNIIVILSAFCMTSSAFAQIEGNESMIKMRAAESSPNERLHFFYGRQEEINR